MQVLVIGASGLVGSAAAEALEAAGCQVHRASRSSDPAVDVTDCRSIAALLSRFEVLDAVVVCVGSVPFKPLADLTRDDYLAAHLGKVQAQIDVFRAAVPRLRDGGSVTLTTGVLAREPIATGVAASMANGAVEAFVMAAAAEAPRGIRVNAISPTVLAEATAYHASFPGFARVPAAVVGQAYVKAVLGVQTGTIVALDRA